MKKITENNYMTVFSDLELSACIQTEHKSQDLQISRIDVQPKTLPEGQTTGTIRLVFSFPATDISGRWYPICQFDRSVKADWYAPVESMTARLWRLSSASTAQIAETAIQSRSQKSGRKYF